MGRLQFEDEVESLRRIGPMDDRDVALLFAADKIAELEQQWETMRQSKHNHVEMLTHSQGVMQELKDKIAEQQRVIASIKEIIKPRLRSDKDAVVRLNAIRELTEGEG